MVKETHAEGRTAPPDRASVAAGWAFENLIIGCVNPTDFQPCCTHGKKYGPSDLKPGGRRREASLALACREIASPGAA
jgi:hypothetical protein